MPINLFDGEYAFLSNFYYAPFYWQGLLYYYVENAFQSFKTFDLIAREKIRLASKPGKAKRLGHKVVLRPDWAIVCRPIMFTFIWQKFTQNEELERLLLATGVKLLIEGNTWGDTYWGVCNGVGQNWLGKLLMRARQDLREGRVYFDNDLYKMWNAN